MSFSSDFARVYDQLNDGADYDALARLVTEHLPGGFRRGLDLGCGTGSLVLALPGDFDLCAVDLSEDMLTIAAAKAQEKSRRLNFLRQDIRYLDLNARFEFCTCLQDTLNYLSSIEEVRRVFSAAAAHLIPGGRLLYDLSTLERFTEDYGSATRFFRRRDVALVWESAYHKRKRVCDFRFTLFIKEQNGRYRMSVEQERQTYFDPDAVAQCAQSAGFSGPRVILSKPNERQVFICEKKG